MTRKEIVGAAVVLLSLWMLIGLRIMQARAGAGDSEVNLPATRNVVPSWRSTRDLPLNHRLVDADLAPPIVPSAAHLLIAKSELTGTYLRSAVRRGAKVRKSDVSRDPLPTARAEEIIISVKPRQEALVEMFPPGTPVRVNGVAATVVAHTPNGVLIAIAPAKAPDLLKKDVMLLMEKAETPKKGAT